MKRRVLLLSSTLDLGGSERQLAEVARNLDPEMFEVHVGCMKAGGLRFEELRQRQIPITVFPMTSFFSGGAIVQALELRSYVLRNKIDLVHAFDVPMDVFGIPAASLTRRPVLVSSQRAHRSLTSGARLAVLRVTDHVVDAIVVNCRFIRDHLIEDENVNPEKIRLCYNGVDLNQFAYRDPEPRPDGRLTVGCVCALRPEKCLPVLIDAFRRLEIPGVRLLIVGDGPDRALLERFADSERVCMMPATDRVAEVLHAMDIFVLPSRTEALSNALMEGMACGCPVIASTVGGNPELTGADERGLLFPAGDSVALANTISKLAGDLDLRRRLARCARAFVEANLSIQTAARRMEEIYLALLTNL